MVVCPNWPEMATWICYRCLLLCHFVCTKAFSHTASPSADIQYSQDWSSNSYYHSRFPDYPLRPSANPVHTAPSLAQGCPKVGLPDDPSSVIAQLVPDRRSWGVSLPMIRKPGERNIVERGREILVGGWRSVSLSSTRSAARANCFVACGIWCSVPHMCITSEAKWTSDRQLHKCHWLVLTPPCRSTIATCTKHFVYTPRER